MQRDIQRLRYESYKKSFIHNTDLNTHKKDREGRDTDEWIVPHIDRITRDENPYLYPYYLQFK